MIFYFRRIYNFCKIAKIVFLTLLLCKDSDIFLRGIILSFPGNAIIHIWGIRVWYAFQCVRTMPEDSNDIPALIHLPGPGTLPRSKYARLKRFLTDKETWKFRRRYAILASVSQKGS